MLWLMSSSSIRRIPIERTLKVSPQFTGQVCFTRYSLHLLVTRCICSLLVASALNVSSTSFGILSCSRLSAFAPATHHTLSRRTAPPTMPVLIFFVAARLAAVIVAILCLPTPLRRRSRYRPPDGADAVDREESACRCTLDALWRNADAAGSALWPQRSSGSITVKRG